jgi:hypothetical protein
MTDKATLTLEYWVAGDELTQRGTILSEPNPLDPEPQAWVREFAAADDGPVSVSPYRESAAFAARTRFFEPGAERFFEFAPRIAADPAASSEQIKALGHKHLLIRFTARLEFEGDYGMGTRFWVGRQHFEVILTNAEISSDPDRFITGNQGMYLFAYDRPHKDAKITSFPAKWMTTPLYEIGIDMIARFDAPIRELMSALPCFSYRALAAKAEAEVGT